MSGTLAYNMRPQSLLDILGQKHIIGENGLFTKFVEKNHPMSVILYGPPAVSYTHLDVYKRQLFISTIQPINLKLIKTCYRFSTC